MLFYNEKDDICLKQGDGFKVLYERDIFERNGQWYTYSHGYFYEGTAYGDGDYETNWEKRIHPRHMNIVEMEEAFAPPSYQSSLDDLCTYKEGISDCLNETEYFILYSIERKVDDAFSRGEGYASISIKDYEFSRVKEEGLRKLLGLLKEDYRFDLYVEEDENAHDRAVVTLFW